MSVIILQSDLELDRLSELPLLALDLIGADDDFLTGRELKELLDRAD